MDIFTDCKVQFIQTACWPPDKACEIDLLWPPSLPGKSLLAEYPDTSGGRTPTSAH